MSDKKYRSDYTLRYDADDKGRIKADAVYTGALYSFAGSDESRLAAAERMSFAVAVAWMLWLLPLLFASGAGHAFYVIFPHVGCGISLWQLTRGIALLHRAKAPLRREHSEQLKNRLNGGCAVSMALAAVAAVGCAVHLIRTSFETGSTVFALAELLLLAALVVIWRQRQAAATKPYSGETKSADKFLR